jgi:D-apionolactonase
MADSEHLRTRIELAVHVDDLTRWDSAPAYFAALRTQLETAACKPARIMVFGSAKDDSTPQSALAAARTVFAGFGVPIGAGTNADLYQLNLQRPPADADFICWSMNPQVHAFDCTSMAETPEAAAQQVLSVREYFPGKPVAVSPITLKPRFNPVATGPEQTLPANELPPEVDPRQLSLFGAAWTLAMIKAVAEAGADSVTFYETTGWRGVMELQTGSTCPAKFPSIPGAVFPLYHVFAEVGEFAGGEILPTESSDPLAVASLLLRKGGRERLLLANLSRHGQKVSWRNVAEPVRARTINASNVQAAMISPETFRTTTHKFTGTGLNLEPHAIASIDFAKS